MGNSNTVQLPEGVELAQRAEKVFNASNRLMESVLACPCDRNQNCLECGNAECFEAMSEQAEVYGITFEEYLDNITKQKAEALEAVKAQAERYERYCQRTETDTTMKTVCKIIQKEAIKEKGLLIWQPDPIRGNKCTKFIKRNA